MIWMSHKLDLRLGPTFCGALIGIPIVSIDVKVIKDLQNLKLADKQLNFKQYFLWQLDNFLNNFRPRERPGPAAPDLAFSVRARQNCYQHGPNDRIKNFIHEEECPNFCFILLIVAYISSLKTFPSYL